MSACVQAAMGAWAPLHQACDQMWLRIDWPGQQLFGAAELQSTGQALPNVTYLCLHLPCWQLSPLFWGSLGCLPHLRQLKLSHLSRVDPTALGVWCAAAQTPSTVVLRTPSNWVFTAARMATAVERVKQQLRQEGVQGVVTLECAEHDEECDIIEAGDEGGDNDGDHA
uniref:Uncharacterized protein n=1 Tax=Chlamydomonas leiostraca TaxID=1034604 RepID=A0A7S0S6R8_9CHLO